MTFKQRLSADYYARVHRDIRARMAEAGIDVLLLDSNDDVIYTTGFSHYTTERPVVFALTQDKALLLIPELERTHCAKQHVAAEPVVYFEFPGIDKPFDVLARALGNVTGTIGHSAGISMARAPQIAAAFPNAKVRPSGIVSNPGPSWVVSTGSTPTPRRYGYEAACPVPVPLTASRPTPA